MQSQLFEHEPQKRESIQLPDGFILTRYPHAFTDPQLFQRVKTSTQWQQPVIRMAGKAIKIPRLQAWFGDADASYQYSGQRLEPTNWTAVLTDIKARVEQLTQVHFNAALVNCYRDGQDSVSWHADDEPDIDQQVPIVSVSLGATRFFRLKPKGRYGGRVVKMALEAGDLLVMPKGFQQCWLHEIPKTKKIVGERINITFRQINPNSVRGF